MTLSCLSSFSHWTPFFFPAFKSFFHGHGGRFLSSIYKTLNYCYLLVCLTPWNSSVDACDTLHPCFDEGFEIQGVRRTSSMYQLDTTIPDSAVLVSWCLTSLCTVCFPGVLLTNSHNSSLVRTATFALEVKSPAPWELRHWLQCIWALILRLRLWNNALDWLREMGDGNATEFREAIGTEGWRWVVADKWQQVTRQGEMCLKEMKLSEMGCGRKTQDELTKWDDDTPPLSARSSPC